MNATVTPGRNLTHTAALARRRRLRNEARQDRRTVRAALRSTDWTTDDVELAV